MWYLISLKQAEYFNVLNYGDFRLYFYLIFVFLKIIVFCMKYVSNFKTKNVC